MLNGVQAAEVRFTPDRARGYVVRLRVTDAAGANGGGRADALRIADPFGATVKTVLLPAPSKAMTLWRWCRRAARSGARPA